MGVESRGGVEWEIDIVPIVHWLYSFWILNFNRFTKIFPIPFLSVYSCIEVDNSEVSNWKAFLLSQEHQPNHTREQIVEHIASIFINLYTNCSNCCSRGVETAANAQLKHYHLRTIPSTHRYKDTRASNDYSHIIQVPSSYRTPMKFAFF